MKLVFFDIECAGVHKTYAKICAFGYVVCDENFNILEKEDILINPKGRFELTNRRGEKGLVLPYDYADFKKQPSFPKVYSRIKALLEDKDSIVLGHAVLNDVKYLNLECRRFHLPPFKFSFADSQLFFMASVNDFSRQFGLEHIAEELGVEFTPHRAADDAYATMRVVQEMCRANNCTYEELVALLGFTNGRTENNNIVRPQCTGFKKYRKSLRKAREARSRARVKFYNNLTRRRKMVKGPLSGKIFCFSRVLEDEIDESIPLVESIFALGGNYSKHVEECTHYVRAENDVTDRTRKADVADKTQLTPEVLKEMLNV